jgi:hypothetical protein
MENGSKVYYATIVMTIIGKTERGDLVLQSPVGEQWIARKQDVIEL